jgi:hypothetical protein
MLVICCCRAISACRDQEKEEPRRGASAGASMLAAAHGPLISVAWQLNACRALRRRPWSSMWGELRHSCKSSQSGLLSRPLQSLRCGVQGWACSLYFTCMSKVRLGQGGWVGLQPSRQQQSTCTQWPARRKDGKERAEEEERKELRAENKSRKRQAKAEEKQPMSRQVPG